MKRKLQVLKGIDGTFSVQIKNHHSQHNLYQFGTPVFETKSVDVVVETKKHLNPTSQWGMPNPWD